MLLRVDAALVCGTDVRIYQGRKQKNVTFPTVLGHEFAGTVVDANGPLPDGVAMGDQVAVYPLVTCGDMRGLPQGTREHLPQPESLRLPAHRRPVPIRAGPGRGAAEPGAGARSAGHSGRHHRTGGVRLQRAETGRDAAARETALIVGCGPLGLIHAGLAKNLGVEKVAAVDPIAGRRDMATRFGADLVLEPGPDAADTLNEFSDGGIDVLVMAIGRIDALTPYLGCLAPGASVSVFAGFGADADLAVSANDVHYNEWNIVGASSCRLDGFHAVAPMVASGALPVGELIGTQLPLDRAVEALDLAGSGADMRVGVDPWA